MTPKYYYIIGFEFNNHWKASTIYNGLSAAGYLIETDNIEDAAVYQEQEAEILRENLQRKFPDFTWYLMKANINTKA